MKKLIENINIFVDKRGTLSYSNDFDISKYKRCYHINHKTTDVLRAWQGHKIESKAFWITKGSFLLKYALVDNFCQVSKKLEFVTIELNYKMPKILKLPGGCINGFKAIEKNSSLMVFSSLDLEQSKKDDFRWDKKFFINVNWN